MIFRGVDARTTAFLNAARDKELLDAADLRLIAWLCDRAGAEDASGLDPLALVTAALCRACGEGSLCLPLEEKELGGILRDFLSAAGLSGDHGSPGDFPESMAARFLADANADRLASVLGTPDNPRPLIRAHDNLYFHRFWFAEKTVAQGLTARAAPSPPDLETLRRVLRETLEENPLRPGGPDAPPLVLSERQQWALVAALRERVFVLSGGPGTGKTTWTAAWLRALLRLPNVTADRVRLCAPTGRAARRLQESLRASLAGSGAGGADAAIRDMPVTTLHALLGYRPYDGRFARGPEDPIDADWILLDEASMADVFLLAALVRALRPDAHLVLAGDPDQLPAVEAGSVLGELLPENRAPHLPAATRDAIAKLLPGAAPTADERSSGTEGGIPSVTLDASHRARGAVIPLAAAIRAGDADAVLTALGQPVEPSRAFAPEQPVARIAAPDGDSADAMPELLKAYARAVFEEPVLRGRNYAGWLERFRTLPREEEPGALDALWELAGRARVLAPLRRGKVSAERANRILRELLEDRWRRPGDARGTGFHGSPILVTRNDNRTGLSNGEIGLWLQAGDGAAVFFPRPDLPSGWLRLPVALLPAHDPGFAVTVHKSQGSECDAVLLLLPEPRNRLLARETLYTAVTRARSAVRVFGAEAAIRGAVENRLKRYGGLRGAVPADSGP